MREGAEKQASAGSLLAENEITERIIGAAIEVHRHLGPGILESAYEACLCYELSQSGLRFQRQVHLPIHYKGINLECAYTMDLLVEDAVVVEIKATEALAPIHSAQLLTYLKSSNKRVGLLINFNVPVLENGLKRIANRYLGPAIPLRPSASSARQSPPGAGRASSIESPFGSSSPRSSPRLRVSASKTAPIDKELP